MPGTVSAATMEESDVRQAVRIARSILDGSVPLLLGCRRILGPIRRLHLDREETLIAFLGVDSETDHLPLTAEERTLWSPQALRAKDDEIEKYTRWAEGMIRQACGEVIRRLANEN